MSLRTLVVLVSFLFLPILVKATNPVLQTQLADNDNNSFVNLGAAVDISDEFSLVGAPGMNNDVGQACLFKRNEQNWLLDSCLMPSADLNFSLTQFGYALALSEQYAIVSGIDKNSGKTGLVYIFKQKNGQWTQEIELFTDDIQGAVSFGSAVSISGNYAVIGAPVLSANQESSVYVYQKTDSGWVIDEKITPDSMFKSKRFGASLMISGDYLIIGDYEHGRYHEGAAYIYKRGDDNWKLQASLKGGTITRNGDYGSSVAISKNYAVVGAKSENDVNNKKNKKAGAAYVYKREGTQWYHQMKLLSNDRAKGDNFGSSVAISGDYISIASENDDNATGSMYLFHNSLGWWSEIFKIQPQNSVEQDSFGHALAISDNYFVVGADNKNAQLSSSGATYVYSLNIDNRPTATEIAHTDILLSLTEATTSTDNDNDGLSNDDELYIFFTDPNNADTDNDGLTDKEEVTLYQSNPLEIDSDNDGLSDFTEIVFYDSDPNVTDSDNDGYSDYVEVTINNTDPALTDSDSDGLSDELELTVTKTNPILADSDGDGLSDNEELNVYQTDPDNPDSDNDGFSDGNEVNYYETDPLFSSDSPGIPTESTSYTPASGQVGTMAFEDEWPLLGDYDFNDAVFNYNIEETKQDGLVKQIKFKLLPVARGAIYENSMRVLINTPVTNIATANIKSKGVTTTLEAIADGNQTLFVIIEKIKDALPPPPGLKMSNTLSGSKKVNGTLFTLFIEFNSPVSPSILGAPPYNSFISRELDNGERLEVHFPGYFPSKQASKRKFGQFQDNSDSSQDRYYQTDSNLPWAMLIPGTWHHTKERVDLTNGYPDILNWAASKGKKNKGWYKSKRKSTFVFDDVPDI